MRRIGMVLLLVLCLMVSGARAAQEYTLGNPQRGIYYTCVDFDEQIPEDVAEIFATLMRVGDEVICGSRAQRRSSGIEEIREDSILMAVRREGKVLLMCAYRNDSDWETCLETDSFIPADYDFDITHLPEDDGEGWRIEANHAIISGDEIWRVKIWRGCYAELVSHEKRIQDGTRMVEEMLYATVHTFTLKDGAYTDQGHGHCSIPWRLAGWEMDDFPVGIEQTQRYVQENQPALGANQAYISCNLREKPTSQSRTLGVYSARVDVLGSQMGTNEPWYHVRVGDTEGWVTASYLLDGSEYDIRYYSMGAATKPPARADQEVELRRSPDGETFARLLPGAMMHVIAKNDGWLHVVIPEDGKITAKVNWDGIYGYVREDEVVLGDTLADLKWK